MFHIALRGTEIAFMERYNYASDLQEEGIPNCQGIIPLTQPLDSKFGPENVELASLLPEMWEKSSKKYTFPYDTISDVNDNTVNPKQDDTAKKGLYYVFDLEKDHEIVHKLLYYISSNLPRHIHLENL